MRHLTIAALATVATLGCQSDSDAPSTTPTNAGTATQNAVTNNATATNQSNGSTSQTTSPGCGDTATVSFVTSDGVTLAADFHPADTANRGAVVLLHMIPPNWDRTSYPPRVREALQALDLNVLNVDRRGAGESDGNPQDAYAAPGKFDVEGAVTFLLDSTRACSVDASKIMLVGASNGTTPVLDYTVGRADLSLPDPAAIAWLSPGTYTQNQVEIETQRARLDPIPILMIHPDNEPWAVQFVDDAIPAWKIVEIPDGLHGTQNFDDGEREAVQLAELVGWATEHIAN